jgi:hypothetical protein
MSALTPAQLSLHLSVQTPRGPGLVWGTTETGRVSVWLTGPLPAMPGADGKPHPQNRLVDFPLDDLDLAVSRN